MCNCYVSCNARCSCDCHEAPIDVNVYDGFTVTQIVDLTMWELELSEPTP